MTKLETFIDLFFKLLPVGPFWNRDRNSDLGDLITGLVQESVRVDDQTEILETQMDPAVATEAGLLLDWERVTGLRDSTSFPDPTLAERRLHVLERLRGITDIHPDTLVAQALEYLSINISVVDKSFPIYEAKSTCIQAVYNEKWRYVWYIYYETSGDSDIDAIYELRLAEYVPDHTYAIFQPVIVLLESGEFVRDSIGNMDLIPLFIHNDFIWSGPEIPV